jgi:hypothetical protein
MNPTLLIAVGAFAVPAIVSLSANFIAWRKDLSGTAQRARSVEEATKSITFWEQWLKLKLALDPDDEAAKRRYQKHIDALALMLEVEAEWEGYRPWEQYSKIRQRLLMVRNISKWILLYRLVYYFGIAAFAYLTVCGFFLLAYIFWFHSVPTKTSHQITWIELVQIYLVIIFASVVYYQCAKGAYKMARNQYTRVQAFKMKPG